MSIFILFLPIIKDHCHFIGDRIEKLFMRRLELEINGFDLGMFFVNLFIVIALVLKCRSFEPLFSNFSKITLKVEGSPSS